MTDTRLPDLLNGRCDERFSAVAATLARHLSSDEHHGAAFAAYFHGECVVDIWGGKRNTPDGEASWDADTMSICFSTTKGVAATALHMAMERTGTSYDTLVADVWPEFGNKGKEAITIRHLLCHEAGVPQIRDEIPDVETLPDWEHMVGVMESLEPLWQPGTANGYHAINFAWLIGETLRRVDGRDISTFIAEEIAGPLGLDGLYIGTPPSEHHRIAPLIVPPLPEGVDAGDAIYEHIPRSTVIYKALSPKGSLVDFFATPQGMSSCIPSISGAFTARSLAKLYGALEGDGEIDGVRILEPDSVKTASTVQNDRADLVIFLPVHWRLGYMSGGSSIRVLGPHDEAYGHVGAGGTVAGVDPRAGVSFGLVYDKWGVTEFLGGSRSQSLVDAVVQAAVAVS